MESTRESCCAPKDSRTAEATLEKLALPSGSAVEVPLPEIWREHVVHVDTHTADEGTRLRRGVDDVLVEHRTGRALTVGPRPRLPCPPVSRSAGLSDHAVFDCPRARVMTSVN